MLPKQEIFKAVEIPPETGAVASLRIPGRISSVIGPLQAFVAPAPRNTTVFPLAHRFAPGSYGPSVVGSLYALRAT
jgi:hypothetical protein